MGSFTLLIRLARNLFTPCLVLLYRLVAWQCPPIEALCFLMVCHYIEESFSWLQGPWAKLKDLPFTVPVGATCQVLDNNLVVVAGNLSIAAVRNGGT